MPIVSEKQQAFVKAALEQPDGTGGSKYWKWANSGAVDWCAIFTCYVASQAGILGKYVYNSWGAGWIPRESVRNGWGKWYEAHTKGFKPQPGDLILYDPWEDWADAYVSPPFTHNGEYYDAFYSSHIGIVISETDENGYFETKEGNTNASYGSGAYCTRSQVYTHKRNINHYKDYHLNGFYRPNWEPRKWVAKDTYLKQEEQENNAILVAQRLLSVKNDKGESVWSLKAIAALLGNMEHESTINPGRWEVGKPKKGSYTGYGLCQWTPYLQLLPNDTDWVDGNHSRNWENNGDLQCEFLEYQRTHTGFTVNGNWYVHWMNYGSNGTYIDKSDYGLETFGEFASCTTKSAYDLARCFLFFYERAYDVGSSAQKTRGDAAEKWYRFLQKHLDEIYNQFLGNFNFCEIAQIDIKTLQLSGNIYCPNYKSIKLYYRWNDEVDIKNKKYSKCLSIYELKDVTQSELERLYRLYPVKTVDKFLTTRYLLPTPYRDANYWITNRKSNSVFVGMLDEAGKMNQQTMKDILPEDFEFKITKVRTATSISVKLELTPKDDNLDVETQTSVMELTPSYPCMWINTGTEISSLVPHLLVDNKVYTAVPVINIEGSLYKLYDTDAEKI
jgi:hypothetical protein